MASGNSDETLIKEDRENEDFEDETATSDYLFVSGSSTMRSDITSHSSLYLSVRGHEITEMDSPRVFSIADAETGSDDVSEMFDELQLGGGSLARGKQDTNGTKVCSNCVLDGKQTNATHLCKSCKSEGTYICHKCLQGHNRWSTGHFVVSLSEEGESSIGSGNESNEESGEMIFLPECLSNVSDEDIRNDISAVDIRGKVISDTREVSYFQEELTNDNSKTEIESNQNNKPQLVKQEPDRSGTLHHPKIRRLRGDHLFGLEKDKKTVQKKNRPRIYNDKLYREILQDKKSLNALEATDESFIKYGTYSIRTDADTKSCFVTGICQLGDGRIVITDSENCRIKILDQNRFNIIASHNIQNNPCLISYMKENNIAVAFANCEVAIVEILEEIEIKSKFETKHVCKGLAYGNGSLYICTRQMIEIYSESGDREFSFQPASTDVKFRDLTSISVSKTGDFIYVSDMVKGIIVMDEEGHVLTEISDNVYEPNGLCLNDVSGKLFATEMNSCRILVVDLENGNVKQVVREVCQKDNPISFCHERISNRLIVGVWRSDSIHVFTCS